MNNEQASAGYIVELYYDLENLNRIIAKYKNKLVELNHRYDLKQESLKLDETDSQLLQVMVEAIRYLINSISIKFYALSHRIESLKSIDNEANNQIYNEINNSKLPSFDKILFLTKEYNKAFVTGFVDGLLIQAQAVYEAGRSGLPS